MQYFTVFLALLLVVAVSAQWDNSYWWYNQQPTQAPNYNWFGSSGHQSDDKGNMWHGNDNAKLMLFAKSSWP
ncbi:unnamed protein product [Caenorhabditis brenneri]